MRNIAIIGLGNVGRIFAYKFTEHSLNLNAVCDKESGILSNVAKYLNVDNAFLDFNPKLAENNIFFLTVPNNVIYDVTRELVDRGIITSEDIVVHTSGSHSSNVLSPATEVGAYTASFYPNYGFSLQSSTAINDFEKILFTMEGHETALNFLKGFLTHIGSKYVEISQEHKPLFHISSCISSSFIVTLLKIAMNIHEKIGIENKVSKEILFQKIKSRINQLDKIELVEGFTGPVSRGDYKTLENQLEILENFYPEVKGLYKELSASTFDILNFVNRYDEEEYRNFIELFNKK